MNAKLLISAVVAALMLSSCHVHHGPAPRAHWHGNVAKPVVVCNSYKHAAKPKPHHVVSHHAPKPMAHRPNRRWH